jgi:hypothetical protein
LVTILCAMGSTARAEGPASLECGVAPNPLALVVDRAGAAELLAAVNHERAAAGIGQLARREDVALIAETHARVMALTGTIFHNDGFFTSATKALLGTRYQGENVGCAPDVAWSHAAFMNSPHHRDNVLNARFNQAGFAVIVSPDGRRYVVENFLQAAGSRVPAPAAPPPAPTTITPRPAPVPSPPPPPPVSTTAPATTTAPPPPPSTTSTVAPTTSTTFAPARVQAVHRIDAAPQRPAAPAAGPVAVPVLAAGLALVAASAMLRHVAISQREAPSR